MPHATISDQDDEAFPGLAQGFVDSLVELLQLEGENDAVALLNDSSVEIANDTYDRWNGGTYGWQLKVRVSLQRYAALGSGKKAVEERVLARARRLMEEHENHGVSQILIVPAATSRAETSGAYSAETGYPSREAFYAARELEEVRTIGEGGFGQVVLARRQRILTNVAVKFFAPRALNALSETALTKARERLLREARLLAATRHPGVVRLLDVSVVAGDPVLVLEYIDGETLDSVRQKIGVLPLEDVSRHMAQVLDALAECHARSTVHRDVSPKNVLIERSGRAVLIDFGLGFSEEFSEGSRLTSQMLGTPGFRAPELEHNPLSTSHAVDVYSAGALAVFLLTGRPPQVGVPICVEGVPPALLGALRRSLEVDPSRRTISVRELRAAFRPPSSANRAPELPQVVAALSEAEVREFLGLDGRARMDPRSAAVASEFGIAAARIAAGNVTEREVALAVLLSTGRVLVSGMVSLSDGHICDEDKLKQSYGGLYAVLMGTSQAPSAGLIDKAFAGACSRGWLRVDTYDAWRPGMPSGSGMRDCYSPTALGRQWLSSSFGFAIADSRDQE